MLSQLLQAEVYHTIKLLAHDSMYARSALYAITIPSVPLSVHHTGDQSKLVEVRFMQFLVFSSHILLVFVG